MDLRSVGCLFRLLVIFRLFHSSSGKPTEQPYKCGYESCHPTKEGYVNVHLIPHSHDDVGWVKTVDQFYYGTRPDLYAAAVVNIYDNVLRSVQKSPDRRFIYVETAFFWKWWLEQSDPEREALRRLVDNGQIEFTGGGWSMNDEAVTNYQSIVDQMTWGLRKLNDTFGDCGRPKMGWQIDPFGHSSEMASIFAQLGYDGIILGRIDFEDKENRLANKSMEMVWRGSKNLGGKTDIFTSVLYNHYEAPAGFCFDLLCQDEPLVDDPTSPEYNIETKAETFIVDRVQDSLASYQTNNVIVPMGRDFAYQEPETWFKSIDKLIKYVNRKEVFNDTKFHLLYSTPSCYAAAVQKDTQGVLSSPLKEDDFFPYATDPHAFWTGFYTSRPTLKRFERMSNNFLQICKQLFCLSNLTKGYEAKVDSLREAMGVLQHHDAVTGTEKEEVAHDYARLLHRGVVDCENVSNTALLSLTKSKYGNFQTCLLANVSQCESSEHSSVFIATVYNPLSRPVNKYVRFPVTGTAYSVKDPDGKTLTTTILPIHHKFQKIFGRKSKATLELVFEATNVPPLGFKSFYVERVEGDKVTEENLELNFEYSNRKGVGFNIDQTTGLVDQLRMGGIELAFDQTFWCYNGSNGWADDFDSRTSGAYVFRPDYRHPIDKVSDTAFFEVYTKDGVVTEIHQTFNEYVSQVVRLYENENHVEFEWLVGPLDLGNDWPEVHGKEVISRFTTGLKSNGVFYTDSNGREMMRRVRNFRPTWNITVNETESSNYYPVTSRIAIRDEAKDLELTVLTDRAQGGSSLADGQVELMTVFDTALVMNDSQLLRNSISDDGLGVGEALIEIAYDQPIMAKGSHYVVLGHLQGESEETVGSIEHDLATRRLLDSWLFFTVPVEENFQQYKEAHVMEFSGLETALPPNVHIMTLEPWRDDTYLLRLEHSFENDRDPILSLPVTIDLKNLFSTFKVNKVRETTLGANQWLETSDRLEFLSKYQSDGGQTKSYDVKSIADFEIELQPMEIRTFIIEIEPK